MFTWADFNQIEMRMFAYLSQDPVMLKAYAEGSDVHADTQSALWPGSDLKDEGLRKRIKGFNFTMIFLGSPPTLSKAVGLPVKVCEEFRNIWLARYSHAYSWMIQQTEVGPEQGYVDTLYGRKARLPALDMSTPEHRLKCAINYPVQTSTADIVKRAMLMCEKECLPVVLQVHDELICDGDVEFPDMEWIYPELHTPYKVMRSSIWS
jgi:DNA polymerase-1